MSDDRNNAIKELLKVYLTQQHWSDALATLGLNPNEENVHFVLMALINGGANKYFIEETILLRESKKLTPEEASASIDKFIERASPENIFWVIQNSADEQLKLTAQQIEQLLENCFQTRREVSAIEKAVELFRPNKPYLGLEELETILSIRLPTIKSDRDFELIFEIIKRLERKLTMAESDLLVNACCISSGNFAYKLPTVLQIAHPSQAVFHKAIQALVDDKKLSKALDLINKETAPKTADLVAESLLKAEDIDQVHKMLKQGIRLSQRIIEGLVASCLANRNVAKAKVSSQYRTIPGLLPQEIENLIKSIEEYGYTFADQLKELKDIVSAEQIGMLLPVCKGDIELALMVAEIRGKELTIEELEAIKINVLHQQTPSTG